MNPTILGISGSPIKDSNTDRLIKMILHATEMEWGFIKLSTLDIHPCNACKGCVSDNQCKQIDDWQSISDKVLEAQALVIGGYSPYGSLDARTKTFLERMYCFRHQKALSRGKLGVAVAVGVNEKGVPGADRAAEQIAHFMRMEEMEVLGQVTASGNVPCLSCGYGTECPTSAIPWVFGKVDRITEDMFKRVEDQTEVIELAIRLGRQIRERLYKRTAL
ncbi:MAG: flavodoxin family protein [Candidatus Brocadiales bacterium]